MFKGARKEDLRQIALEIGESISEKMTIYEISNIIKNSEQYKTEPDLVTNIAEGIIEERKSKSKDQREIDLENIIIEKTKLELELARLRVQTKPEVSASDHNESLDSLVKSIRTLTVKVPSRPEGWGHFFASLERAFSSKNVPEKYKAEILLNLLGDRATNVITYIKDEDLTEYPKIKSIVIREFEPTPQACLENFRKTTKQQNETYVQFSSRLLTSFNYYLSLRDVSDFESLKQLIISDKIFQTLDRDAQYHISLRQADSWFKPNELSKEIDLYYTSRGKPLMESAKLHKSNQFSRNVSKAFFSDVKSSKCILSCNEYHPVYKCPFYKNMSVHERIEVIKNNNLCFGCLSNRHRVSECTYKSFCNCGKRHHYTIHLPQEQKQKKKFDFSHNKSFTSAIRGENGMENVSPPLNPSADLFIPSPESQTENKQTNDYFVGASFSNTSKIVLLSTFVCLLSDKKGNKYPFRGILDNGANACFLSSRCAETLQLKKEKINISVSGLNNSSLSIYSKVNTTISNEAGTFKRTLDFLIAPRITDFTPVNQIEINITELQNVHLADQSFNLPGPIDILLGSEIFYELLIPGKLYPSNTKLILQNSVFGYIVSGSVPVKNANKVHCGLIKEQNNLDETLKRFWELENVEIIVPKSKEHLFCEEHFQNNHSRDETGRYIVKMPLKEDPLCLGQSKEIALRKLNSLWRRFEKDPEYLSLYANFMHEYRELGHMQEISEPNEEIESYYIPHLGVYRPQSKTSPLRVVFNASTLTTKGNSLNSIQFNGGVIQDDLFTIMVRFRKYVYAFTADIKKMYRMISIHPSQRPLQRILWKDNVSDPVKTYELTTVTYGTVSAPFLAMRTLKQLSIDESEKYPLAAEVLDSDVYMDDILTGSDDLDTAKEIQNELINLLNRGGMKLHKWCSNNAELSALGQTYPFSDTEETKALGVIWNSKQDCLAFHIQIDDFGVTKREVLSTIAQIFDPLGLLGPVVTKAKIFLQKLWVLNLNWDDCLPPREIKEWQRFSEALPSVNNIEIERCILIEKPEQIEIHGFCDASMSAFGAVVYCKSQSSSGEVSCKLIASKSKVAPLKNLTIPKLELSAALLLAKLVTRVTAALKLNLNSTYLWSDSLIVLSWLQKEPYQLKTFVANRVAKIHELTLINQWRHVSSELNPADPLSRGTDPEKINGCKLWWYGPEFLLHSDYPNREIPTTVIQTDFSNELKILNDTNFVFLLSNNLFFDNLLNLSNNYHKLIRIFSYICRFIARCRKIYAQGPIGLSEFKNAENLLLKNVQKEFYEKDKIVSKLNCLNVFRDSEGVLRVGGRLEEASLPYEQKHPVVIPKGKLSEIIFQTFHVKQLHVGPQALLNSVRTRFWPLGGRGTARKIVHGCVTCFKVKPKLSTQIMGNLPFERVNATYVFNHTGLDLCGPFLVRYKNQRKGLLNKIYICVCICLATRAIHLEILSDLTAEALIATLKRFISRRGKCAKIFSDNATNFIGANAMLKKWHNLLNFPDKNVAAYLTAEGIDWKYIPPRSPHWGGLWEAGVKSVKFHLKRAVGKMHLTYEEFETVVIQIEGLLNSRPLTPLSDDNENYEALTPAHFLIGRPISALVEPQVLDQNESHLKKWQKTSKIVQQVWKKWRNDYLNNLQQRSKWIIEKENLKVGILVLLKEDNLPCCTWVLGKIVEVFPGKDKKVRLVSVKTATGVYKRPITKIAVLPLEI